MELSTKSGSESEGVHDEMHDENVDQIKKKCIDCQATRTPCWRSGPAGIGTLCNACGIRYRKRRRADLGLDIRRAKRSKRKMTRSSSGSDNNKMGVALKLGFMDFGRDLVLQKEWKRKLGEEEQAAMLLMALSCGSVCA